MSAALISTMLTVKIKQTRKLKRKISNLRTIKLPSYTVMPHETTKKRVGAEEPHPLSRALKWAKTTLLAKKMELQEQLTLQKSQIKTIRTISKANLNQLLQMLQKKIKRVLQTQ